MKKIMPKTAFRKLPKSAKKAVVKIAKSMTRRRKSSGRRR